MITWVFHKVNYLNLYQHDYLGITQGKLLKSLYQHDYLGIPQGKLLKSTYQHDYLGSPQCKLLKSTYKHEYLGIPQCILLKSTYQIYKFMLTYMITYYHNLYEEYPCILCEKKEKATGISLNGAMHL